MRFAVIRKECTFYKGGAERYCANFCRMLAEKGHKVFILAKECDKDINPSITHIPVSVNNFTSSTKNLSFHRNCQQALKILSVDKVYALSRTYPSDGFRVSDPLHLLWMDIRYPGRIANFIQKINPRHKTILKLESRIFNPEHTKVVITNSRLAKKQVCRVYSFPEERVYVIYNGVDLKKFSPSMSSMPHKKNVPVQLLFVAMDFKRKGLAHIINALALLKAESVGCCLKVVGRGKTGPYKKQAKKLGVAGLIEFAGPSGEVETFYRAADLLVFPTMYDPFANVCLEALACGLPVITTTNNGAAEVINEGSTGYIIDSEKPVPMQIARKVMQFESMPLRERENMARLARAGAEEFTITGNVEKTIEIFERI